MNAPIPNYPVSKLIKQVIPDKMRIHKGDGDMWPITWADDDILYAAAGDNTQSPMNFWKIIGDPEPHYSWVMHMELIHKMPIDPNEYCQRPNVHPEKGVKPAGLICLNGVLYLAVELHNYGENPVFNRQRNVSTWIITSTDYGVTWNKEATPQDFFTGRLSSPHFLQFGKNYESARDGYVYSYFPAADDGNSYWENGDYILLGRVSKEKILIRDEWEFYVGSDAGNDPLWSKDDSQAKQVFRYPLMTGENHVSYNEGLKRYIMGNYSFLNQNGEPVPYHGNVNSKWPESAMRSQLTLFEAPEPWGPWSLFYQDDDWGTYGDYQPVFPTKWMTNGGKTMWMASSGSYDDYNLTIQKLDLIIDNNYL